MKRYFLLLSCLSLTLFNASQAQVVFPNPSFENWSNDTNYLNLNVIISNVYDTAYTYDPDGWTSSNKATDGNVFSHKRLCTPGTDRMDGNLSLKLTTDSVTASVNPYNIKFVAPGFAVIGDFKINLSAFVNFNGPLDLAYSPGAGIPVSDRRAKIGGYLKYAPQGGDTATVVAVLRRGSTLVARASYIRTTTDAGFTYFEAPFEYVSCLVPDTMVMVVASGDPRTLNNVAQGVPTGLHKGSVLLADSLFLGDTIASFNFAPFAVNDSVHTANNTSVPITVTANDQDCYGRALTVTAVTNPANGTLSLTGTTFTYTPNTGYQGLDTFTYALTAAGGPSVTARVKISVSGNVGIADVSTASLRVYPNPANTELMVTNINAAVKQLRVYDMLGKAVRTESVNSDAAKIDVSNFNTGMYFIQLSNEEGKVIGSTKFAVVR